MFACYVTAELLHMVRGVVKIGVAVNASCALASGRHWFPSTIE